VAGLFGTALDPYPVRLHRRKWWWFQPRDVVMAPDGHLWFHPGCAAWCEDFALASLPLKALLMHELVHVLQHQRGIRLPLRRHPFCRYHYHITPGRPFARYGLEQQAMIVQHAFISRDLGLPDPALESLLADAGLQRHQA
jgi:hypothetical protein